VPLPQRGPLLGERIITSCQEKRGADKKSQKDLKTPSIPTRFSTTVLAGFVFL